MASPPPLPSPPTSGNLTSDPDASSQLFGFLRGALVPSRTHALRRPNNRAHSTLPTSSASPPPLVNLESVSLPQMTLIRALEASAVLFNLAYLLAVTALARARWAPDASCATTCAAVLLRRDFRGVVLFNAAFCGAVTLSAALASLYVLCTHWRPAPGAARRPEVLWASLLLLPTVSVTNSPFLNLDRIHVLGLSLSDSASSALAVARYVANAYAVAAVTLYLVLKFGSMESATDLSDGTYGVWFYTVRCVPGALLFVALAAGGIARRAEISPLPIVPLVSLVRGKVKGEPYSGGTIASAVVVGVGQVVLLLAFLSRYYYTSRRITKMNYREARLKTINIFFLYRHTIVPLLTSMLGTAAATALFPTALVRLGSGRGHFSERSLLDVPYFARSGVVLTYTVWALIECWSAFPSDYRPTAIERIVIERMNKARLCPRPSPHPSLVRGVSRLASGTGDGSSGPDEAAGFVSAVSSNDSQRPANLAHLSPVVWEADPSWTAPERASTLRVNEAVLAFNLSWCAYLEDDTIEAVLKDSMGGQLYLQGVWREVVNDLCVFVAMSETLIVASFRGSVSAINMKVNLTITQTRHLPEVDDEPEWLRGSWKAPAWARIPFFHRGFDRAYSALKGSGFLSVVRDLHAAFPQRRVMCVGHSLGGALATLASFDVRVELGVPEDQVSCLTFGSPRVGNAPFARRVAAVVTDNYRFVNLHDFISNHPKRRLQGYSHVPRCALVTLDGNLILDPRFADLQMFHGSKLRSHVLSAYKTSLQSFIHIAQMEDDVVEDDRFVPDFWDFAKYAKAVLSQGGKNSPLTNDAVSPDRNDDPAQSPDMLIERMSDNQPSSTATSAVSSLSQQENSTGQGTGPMSVLSSGRAKLLHSNAVSSLLARLDRDDSGMSAIDLAPSALLGDDLLLDEENRTGSDTDEVESGSFRHYYSCELPP